MIVVSNTTPLRYLIEVDAIHILPGLFRTVTTTPTVISELNQSNSPDKVRLWSRQLPNWLTIHRPHQLLSLPRPLHPGETEALSLAKERSAFRLLIDDRNGVDVARTLSLPVLRTLAMIAVAGEEKLIDANLTIRRLALETKFRATPHLFERYLTQEKSLRAAIERQRNEIASERLRTGQDTP